MQPRKTITIVTSPAVTTVSLPACSSPTTKQGPIQYRIEERSRTVYVTSDVDPSQWNPHNLDQLLSLADVSRTGTDDLQSPRPESTKRHTPRVNDGGTSDKGGNVLRKDSARSRRSEFFPPSATGSSSAESSKMNSPRNGTRPRILFYHKQDPHYGFTNFSEHPVVYKGKKYPTSEHLFQSFKFQDHRPNLAEHIRTCSERPSVAFSEARRFQPEVRRDWKDVNIEKMHETLWHKFTQHADLKAELLATGDAELVEDSDKDAFWGVGPDGQGRNELGKALERLRAKLRET